MPKKEPKSAAVAKQDQAGPVSPKQIVDFRQLGVSGLRRYSGFVLEDFLPQLQLWRGIDIYREMSMNDPDVGATLFAIRMMCRRVPWRVQPSTMLPFDQEAAKWLETCLNDMSRPWADTCDEIMLNMLPYGYAAQEIVYKRRCGNNENPSMNSSYSDGRIGWRKFEIRHPDTVWKWEFDEEGGILGLWQMAPPRFQHVFIPMQKMVLYRTTGNKNNPEGLSILRNAYRPWYMKKQLENIEAVGAERDLAGLPIAYVPAEMLSDTASAQEQQQIAAIKKILTNVRRDEQEGVVWPRAYDANGKDMFEFKLLSAPGQRQFDCDKIIQRYRQSIMQTVFADFILLGHNSSGNRSIVEKRADMFCVAVGSFMDIICDVMNKYAVPRLFSMNPDIEISDYPKIKHGDLQAADLDMLSNYFLRLSQTGMPLWPNPELQKHLMEAAHAPAPIDPMKIADELEIQPRKDIKPADIKVILPEEPAQSATPYMPVSDTPVPGVPPANPGQRSMPVAPYPIPPGTGL